MGCGAAEATGLGFVCFVVINPRVLSANSVDLGFFLFLIFSNFTPPLIRGFLFHTVRTPPLIAEALLSSAWTYIGEKSSFSSAKSSWRQAGVIVIFIVINILSYLLLFKILLLLFFYYYSFYYYYVP